MDEQMLAYYNRELMYLRESGAEFAKQHPDIAGRLRIDGERVEDPHVSRLIESFAFLTARIRYTLDDSFPELTQSLLSLLFPSFVSALPSMSVLRFSLMPELKHVRHLPAGSTVYVDAEGLPRCLYKTVFDTTLLPGQVASSSVRVVPKEMPQGDAAPFMPSEVASVLEVQVQPNEPQGFAHLDKLTAQCPLRFYLDAEPRVAFLLYEYLFEHLLGIGVVCQESGQVLQVLDTSSIRPSALAPFTHPETGDEQLGMSKDHGSQQLLSHFFAFPQQFTFFELTRLGPLWSKLSGGLKLVFYFSKSDPVLSHGVKRDTLSLGCVPVINLFDAVLRLKSPAQRQREVRVSLDGQPNVFGDIHQIRRVFLCDSTGERIEVPPLYATALSKTHCGLSWVVRKEVSHTCSGQSSQGIETFIGFVDARHEPVELPEHWQIEIEATCTNRDLPGRLPFGPDQPKFEFYANQGAGLRTKCLIAPTATLLPELDRMAQWLLVTNLSLQSFSGPDATLALRQALSTLNRFPTAQTRLWVSGIVSLKTSVKTLRFLQAGRSTMCRGTALHLVVDETCYSGTGVYLFGVMLNEFFSQFCAMNSFVQLSISSRQQDTPLFTWPARTGAQGLL